MIQATAQGEVDSLQLQLMQWITPVLYSLLIKANKRKKKSLHLISWMMAIKSFKSIPYRVHVIKFIRSLPDSYSIFNCFRLGLVWKRPRGADMASEKIAACLETRKTNKTECDENLHRKKMRSKKFSMRATSERRELSLSGQTFFHTIGIVSH